MANCKKEVMEYVENHTAEACAEDIENALRDISTLTDRIDDICQANTAPLFMGDIRIKVSVTMGRKDPETLIDFDFGVPTEKD